MGKKIKLPRTLTASEALDLGMEPQDIRVIANWHFDHSVAEGDRHDMIGFRLSLVASQMAHRSASPTAA